jgi:hypothetical protein
METKQREGTARAAAAPGALYCLGVIGGWVWFWQAADGFWGHAWALVQGLVWPAYLVYEVLALLRG